MIRRFPAVCGLFYVSLVAMAQDGPADAPSSSLADRVWISGQANFIGQGHRSFRSPYAGVNSLSSDGQAVVSRVFTLFTGFRLNAKTDVLLDLEATGGHGIGEALGVAGFTNLDVVRNPSIGKAPYIGRVMLHRTIPLSKETVKVDKGVFQFSDTLPVRRLDIRIGKMGTVDFFDVNSVGSDSHYQFMNWSLDNNGAYDYAADTRGYTYGIVLDYSDRNWSLRYGEMLMPKVANGLHLDANLARARAENVEFEVRQRLWGKLVTMRPLAFVNHANMGSYREANLAYRAGRDEKPDITAHRIQGRIKYGFGFNTEQELPHEIRAFERWSWNEGRNESFAYTEIDQSFSGGADVRGGAWHRKDDKAGAAIVSNAISRDHQEYLKLGGAGFLLGDGFLNYGRENILETYYTARLFPGVYASLDLQRIWNPGYNRDRGPAFVGAVRMHFEGVLFHAGR